MCKKISFQSVILASLILSGCGKGNFAEYNQLGSLRVLALHVNQPEVSPGASVTLTPVLSDIVGAGRALSWKAEGCIDPGVGFGAAPSCARALDRKDLGSGAVAPALVPPAYTQAVAHFSVTVPTDILLNRNTVDQTNGVAYLVTYQVSASDGTMVNAFKRIIASNRTQKNTNPTILDVLNRGTSLSALPTESTSLSIRLQGGSTESYSALTTDGQEVIRSETLITTWFVSDGNFEKVRVLADSENPYSPPSIAPIGHSVVIVPIVHDGRGGDHFQILSF